MNPNYTDSGWVVKTERRKYKTNKVIQRIMSHLETEKKEPSFRTKCQRLLFQYSE